MHASKKLLIFVTVAVVCFSFAGAALAVQGSVFDDFNDNTISPAWIVLKQNNRAGVASVAESDGMMKMSIHKSYGADGTKDALAEVKTTDSSILKSSYVSVSTSSKSSSYGTGHPIYVGYSVTGSDFSTTDSSGFRGFIWDDRGTMWHASNKLMTPSSPDVGLDLSTYSNDITFEFNSVEGTGRVIYGSETTDWFTLVDPAQIVDFRAGLMVGRTYDNSVTRELDLLEVDTSMTKEDIISALSDVSSKVDALSKQGVDVGGIKTSIISAESSADSGDLEAAQAMLQDVQTSIAEAEKVSVAIASAEMEISIAKNLEADTKSADDKLASAKDAFSKESYDIALRRADEAKSLAKSAGVPGVAKISDIVAQSSKYDGRTVTIVGNIQDLKVATGAYSFSIDDGSAIMSVTYSKALGGIVEGDNVRVEGIYSAYSKSVAATSVERETNIIFLAIIAVVVAAAAFAAYKFLPKLMRSPGAAPSGDVKAPKAAKEKGAPAEVMRKMPSSVFLYVTLLGIILVLIGSIGPWAKISSTTLSVVKYGYEADGVITMIMGAVAILVFIIAYLGYMNKVKGQIANAILGIIIAAMALYEISSTGSKLEQLQGLSALVSLLGVSIKLDWGIYMVLVGGMVMVAGAVIYLFSARK